MLSPEDLHPYQHRAIEFIKEQQSCGLLLEMGLGKTASTLTAISDLIDSFAIEKTLVLAPLRVANSVWRQEAANWAHLRHLRVVVCTGTERKRLAALQAPADIYVINYENTAWLVNALRQNWPFDMTVIDESQSYKSAKSQRFKALKRIVFESEYRVLLTGTPAPNSLLDIWSQMFLIDGGDRLGKTMLGYKQKYFSSEDYQGFTYKPKEGSAVRIHELIGDKMLSMRASDYLQLPDRLDIAIDVELPPAALKVYRDFERTSFAQFPVDIEVDAVNAAVLAGRLLQMASGSIYTDAHHNYHVIHDAKLDALEGIINNNSGENIMVAYNYRSDLERLQKRFPHGVVLDKSQATEDRWNRGEIPLLFLSPHSAGHGLNLQYGGSVIIWFGLVWALGAFQQTNARLHRQGQAKPVRVFTLVATDTIDSRVVGILADKGATQESLLKALRP